jgi:hypothetical protein
VIHQRSIHALPIGSELLPVNNFAANDDDIGRYAGISLGSWLGFTDGRDSTVHEHAEIFVTRGFALRVTI